MPDVRQIRTLDELVALRQSREFNLVICPAIEDFNKPHHARDVLALPGDVLWRVLKAGLYIHTPTDKYHE